MVMAQLSRQKCLAYVPALHNRLGFLKLGGTAAAAELLVNFVHQRMEVAPAAVRWQEVDRWMGGVGVSVCVGGGESQSRYMHCTASTYTQRTQHHTHHIHTLPYNIQDALLRMQCTPINTTSTHHTIHHTHTHQIVNACKSRLFRVLR